MGNDNDYVAITIPRKHVGYFLQKTPMEYEAVNYDILFVRTVYTTHLYSSGTEKEVSVCGVSFLAKKDGSKEFFGMTELGKINALGRGLKQTAIQSQQTLDKIRESKATLDNLTSGDTDHANG